MVQNVMRQVLAASVVITAMSVPGWASAQTPSAADAVSMFERVCLDTDGDRQAALDAMEVNGWIVAPEAILPQLPQGLSNMEARLGSTTTSMWLGFVGDSARPQDDNPLPVCAVSVSPGILALTEATAAWGQPARSGAGQQLFAFRTDGQDRQAILDLTDADAEELARAGHLFMVAVESSDRGTMLMRLDPTF